MQSKVKLCTIIYRPQRASSFMGVEKKLEMWQAYFTSKQF
jgi:hypothetical protein